MKTYIVFTLFAIILIACNHEKPSNTIDQVYDFAETTDLSYCNPDSILGTDCGGGIIYFTKKGNVLYTFTCFGSDTTRYEIGTYKDSEKEVVCTFDKSYSFYNGFKDDEEPQAYDPNSGAIIINDKWSLKLQKISYGKFEFGFMLQDGSRFALNKANKDSFKIFMKDLKSINKLTEILK